MQALPRRAQVYVVCVWAVAGALLAGSLALTPPALDQILLLPLWTIIYIITDYFDVEFGLEDGKKVLMTVYEAVIIFLIAVSGLAALPALFFGALITDALHRRKWYRNLFNASERVITYTAMWVAYHAISVPGALPFTGPAGLAGLLAAVGVYYVFNTLLISTVLALVSEQPIMRIMRETFLMVQWVHALTLPIGAMLAALWFVDRWLILAGVVPLLIAQRSFRAVGAWQIESRRNKELARQVEQLQEITTTMVSSLNPAIVLDTISVRLAGLLQAEVSWVVLIEGHRFRMAAAHGTLPEWAEARSAALAKQHAREIIQADIEGADQLTQTLAAIPMALEDRVLGYICLIFHQPSESSPEEPVELGEGQRRVLLAFAAQAALVIEHANLFDALQHKQNELIRSSKLAALGTFSAGIAHEFNNILAGILGYSQLGRTSDDMEEQREALTVIEQSAIRARGITSGLLAFARRSSPQRRLNYVREAVDAALMLVERELLKSNITVDRQYGAIPLTVCDNDQLTQVVLNLLTNARDSMADRGGGTITVSLQQSGQMIELRVRDTGSGIPEELLDQIFQPFMTTKGALGGSTTPGTGLGLAISYGIIESHAGTIDVESQVGVGTTMIVRLPIIEEPEAAPAHRPGEGPIGSLRILVVDDDQHVLGAIAQLLTQHSHRVRVASGGEAALMAYCSEQFDLVLSDVVMPGMDGLALTRELRRIDPKVRVIAMTGQPGIPQLDLMLQAGAVGPLIKPFTIEELLSALSQYAARLEIARPTRPLAQSLGG